MGSSTSCRMHFLCISLIALLMVTHVSSSPTPSPLSPTFYSFRCPGIFSAIRSVVQVAVRNERRMGASLIRLFFHDCFVNGCDASILLTGAGNTSELNALPNINSVRGMNVIANAKAVVDSLCGPGIVSCADIVAVAARDSVVELGGPNFTMPVGRRDGLIANFSGANSDLPGFFESLENITAKFNIKGLTQQEMVVLSGAHTVGQAQCFTFRDRIYNETNIDPAFATLRKANCPPTGGDTNLSSLDVQTPNTFDNAYFQDLVQLKGLLHSDQVLFNGGPTDFQVGLYSGNQYAFYYDFLNAMIKMGNIGVLTGTQGQIRNNCSRIN